MFETILICITLIYIAEMLYLRIGLGRADVTPQEESYQPVVSVIVAARNEEEYIGDCVRSLLCLEYPPEKLDIIVVNDSSTDRTGDILEAFGPRPFLRILSTPQSKGNLHGKTNAIELGIKYARGEIIMLTDADCTVRPSWVARTVKYFGPSTGIVGGFTLLTTGNLFERIQCLDWLYLFSVASATVGWDIPLSVIGNNFAVRRDAYLRTGGYENIPFSVTEDFALVQAVLRHSDFRIRFPLDPLCLVQSHPCRSLRHLYRQKQRWGVGGLDMVFRGVLIMAISWLIRFLMILALIFTHFIAAALLALTIIAFDLLLLWKPMRKFSALKKLLRSFLPFEVYLTLYVLTLPIIALASKSVVWKERRIG